MAELATSTPLSGAQFDALMKRAGSGDQSCLPQLRTVLADQTPGSQGANLLKVYGNPPEWLKQTLISKAGGKDLAVQEAIRVRMSQLQAELEGPNPSAIERLLAERAVYCWFILYRFEANYAQADGMTIKQADYHQRRIDSAHKRFLSALATLAKVRRKAVPNLLVAIGKKQEIKAG